jgi:hypothetical protein
VQLCATISVHCLVQRVLMEWECGSCGHMRQKEKPGPNGLFSYSWGPAALWHGY